jgi:transposase InsO family protein
MQHSFRLPKVWGRPPVAPPRSRDAKLRLRILEYAQSHSVAATCQHFGIARSTHYRWKGRFVPIRPGTLENRSSRPCCPRPPTWTTQEVMAVRDPRQQFPRMGKDKLTALPSFQAALSDFQQTYNHLRPHQALSYRTPAAVSPTPHIRSTTLWTSTLPCPEIR